MYVNHHLVDEVDDLVLYGSQVSWKMSSTIRLVATCTLVLPYHGYCIINNTKYSIAKRGPKNEYWGFNPHYGLNILTLDMLEKIQVFLKDGRRF